MIGKADVSSGVEEKRACAIQRSFQKTILVKTIFLGDFEE
jgi:hypothetical protein